MFVEEDSAHRCEFSGCNEADVLPTRCGKCRMYCCDRHLSYEAHRCANHFDTVRHKCPICDAPVRVPNGQRADRFVSEHIDSGCTLHIDTAGEARGGINASVASQQAHRIAAGSRLATIDGHAGRLNFCSFGSCTKNEDVPVTCPNCKQSYCFGHRSPLDHACVRSSPPPSPQPVIADPSKPLARRLQPTKLQKRKFSNTVATAHFREKIVDGITVAVFVGATPSEGAAPFYITFQRLATAGLALDRLCRAANVVNANNTAKSDEDKWFIFCLSSGTGVPMEMALAPDMTVAEVATDGDVWFVGKGPQLPEAIAAEAKSHTLKVAEGRRVVSSPAAVAAAPTAAPNSKGVSSSSSAAATSEQLRKERAAQWAAHRQQQGGRADTTTGGGESKGKDGCAAM